MTNEELIAFAKEKYKPGCIVESITEKGHFYKIYKDTRFNYTAAFVTIYIDGYSKVLYCRRTNRWAEIVYPKNNSDLKDDVNKFYDEQIHGKELTKEQMVEHFINFINEL